MDLIWNSVVGYEGIYEISNAGDVRSLDRKVTDTRGHSYIVKGRNKAKIKDKDGYLLFRASKKGKQKLLKIHREVLKAFKPLKYMDDLQVNHIDKNKTNNKLANLEWCGGSWNNLHKLNSKLTKNSDRAKHEDLILDIVNRYLDGDKHTEISKDLGISLSFVTNVLSGRYHKDMLRDFGVYDLLTECKKERKKKTINKWIVDNHVKFIVYYTEGCCIEKVSAHFKKPVTTMMLTFRYIGNNYPEYLKERRRNIRNNRV